MFPSDSDLEAQFTFETDATPVPEEPPFHILMLGDWSGDGKKKDLAQLRPIAVDRDNFDSVMKKLNVRADVRPDGDGSSVISLSFSEIEDFHPDRIFRQIPLFAELRGKRKNLLDPNTFESAAREVRSWLPEAARTEEKREAPMAEPTGTSEAEAPPESGEGLLDRILSQPGEGPTSARMQASVQSDLGRLVSRLVEPHLVRTDESEQAELLSVVDSATSALMRKILHNWKFQSLEAAWRGLYMLVRQVETDVDLKIFILDITKEELENSLKEVDNLTETDLYRILIRETIETPGGEPFAVWCGNYAFLPGMDDVAALIRLGKLAAVANAPFVSHMRPDVLGVTSLAESPDPRSWDLSVETDRGKLWAALRGQAESSSIGLSIPRFLGRLPYGSDTDPVESFSFEEFDTVPAHDSYLWINPSFLNALLLAQSYRASGWDMGQRLLQDVSGLPVHIYEWEGETLTKPCAEVLMTVEACETLLDLGLMPMISFRGTDRVRLGRVQSISSPPKPLKGLWN